MKAYFFFFIIILALVTSSILEAQEQKPVKVALVLSGGGAKGFAHIGALKVLEEEGIPVDIIVGTSIGSIVGSLYSIGYSATEIEAIAREQNWSNTLSDEVPRLYLSPNDQLNKQRYFLSLPAEKSMMPTIPRGLVQGQNVLNLFCGLTSGIPAGIRFSELPIEFACIACDLETGNQVVIDSGFMPTALLSSMAIPGAFHPVEHNGYVLIDGGAVNNFPADVAKQMGADVIIGVDIRNELYTRDQINSLGKVFDQLVAFMDRDTENQNKTLCNVIIQPDITGYGTSSFNSTAVDSLIRRGEEATRTEIEKIRALKQKYNLEPKNLERSCKMPESWLIRKIELTGKHSMDEPIVRRTLGLKLPGTYTYQDIKSAIDRLYGFGNFNKIYFDIEDRSNERVLSIIMNEKRDATLNIGFNVNTTDAAGVLLNITRKNYRTIFGLISFSTKLSANPEANLLAEMHHKRWPTFGIQFDGKYQKFKLYNEENQHSNGEISYGAVKIYTHQRMWNRAKIGIGMRGEYYNGNVFSGNQADSAINIIWKDNFLTSFYGYLTFDNLDHYYYPSRGTSIFAEVAFVEDFFDENKLYPTLTFSNRNIIPITSNLTFLLNLNSRIIFSDNYYTFKSTVIGGEEYSTYFNYHFPFVGVNAFTPVDRFAYLSLAGFRLRVAQKHYLSLLGNGLMHYDDWADYENAEFIFGGGIKYSYRSMLGPIECTIGSSTFTRKPVISANLGFWF